MEQPTTYQSYSKYRKPFLTSHYPFLTSNQINAKLRQEWVSLKSSKITKAKGTKTHSVVRCRSKSPLRRRSISPYQKQMSLSSSCRPQKFFQDPTSKPPWRATSDNDDDDEDIEGSPYQRSKSRIDELNRSALTNTNQQRQQMHRPRYSWDSMNKFEGESKTETGYWDTEYPFDEGDCLQNTPNTPHFTRNMKNYSGNSFRLKYQVPAVEFDEDNNNAAVTPSILKNSRSVTFTKSNDDTPKSKVRFSRPTPDGRQSCKDSKSKTNHSSTHRSSKLEPNKGQCYWDEIMEPYPNQKKSRTESRFVSTSSNYDFDFDNSIDAPYRFCSYSTFKTGSNMNTSNDECKSSNKGTMSTLVKSKSTSLLQNTISSCSKFIKKSKRSPRSYSRRKSAIEQDFPSSHFSINHAVESKSKHRSTANSQQPTAAMKVTPSSKFDYDDYAGLYTDDEYANLPLKNKTSSKQTKPPSVKEASSKKLTPSTIARQLRSMTKQFSASKILSPKKRFQESHEPSKSKHYSASKKGQLFSKSKSESNVRDLLTYNDGNSDFVVNQRRKQTEKSSRKVPPSNTIKRSKMSNTEYFSFSKELCAVPVSESWNSPETLKIPSSRKKVSFYSARSHAQSKDEHSSYGKGLDAGFYAGGEAEYPQEKPSRSVKSMSLARQSKNNSLSSVDTNRLLRSISSPLSTTKMLKSWDWEGASKESLPLMKGISFYRDDSDVDDKESLYSEDEKAGLIVRQEESSGTGAGDNVHDDFDEDTGYYGSKDNNDREGKLCHTFDECRSRSSAMSIYCKRDNRTVSYGDDEVLYNFQNRNLNYNKTKGLHDSDAVDGEDEADHRLRRCKQTKSAPTMSACKRKGKSGESEKSCRSQTHSRSIDKHTSFTWSEDDDDDDDDQNSSINDGNGQWNENEDDHKKLLYKSKDVQLNETRKHANERLQPQSSKKMMREYGQDSDIGKCKRMKSEEWKSRTQFEGLYYRGEYYRGDDNDEINYHDNSNSNENDNCENIFEVSNYEYHNKGNTWMSCNDKDEYKEEDDQDAFFPSTKSKSRTDTVLRGALRRIHSMQSLGSDFVPTVCKVNEGMVNVNSDPKAENDYDDSDCDSNDVTRDDHYYGKDWSMQQRMSDGYTLTDLFDDLPENRPQLDTLGMARRMFQSSRMGTCSNFGSLFDEDDIFV